jgi:hypothetical protein
MIQEIVVLILFLAATYFIGRSIYKSWKAKDACTGAGCSKCAIDFNAIEDKINKSQPTPKP